MRIPTGIRQGAGILIALAAVAALYAVFARPWLLRWGATDAEVAAVLPGDALVPRPAFRTTRAVTIAAPIERVWPWVAQLGQDRGGFYSFEILEDLVGAEMPRAERLLAGRQDWHAGDRLWMYPPRKLAGEGSAPLVVHRPGRTLVFATHTVGGRSSASSDIEGLWGFHLAPLDDGSTRLVVRGCGARGMGALGTAFHHAVFEPAHFVMERRMMANLAALAEGRRPTSRAWEAATVVLWTANVALMIAAAVVVVRRARPIRAWLGGAAALLLFMFLTLAQPPLAAGVALTGALVLAQAGALRRRALRA